MDKIISQNKALDKYTVSELKTLCASTRNVCGYRSLKKKELYNKVISENVFEKYTNQQSIKNEEEKRKLERAKNAKRHEEEMMKDTTSQFIKASDIQECELIYGDYPDESNVFYNIEDNKKRKEFIMSAFDLKDSDFKFGNYICFSTYRQTGLVMIGKDENFIDDFGSDYGYELPYSICKHLTDAVNTFKALEFYSFNLDKNDYTVRSTVLGDLPDNWSYVYLTIPYEEALVITSGTDNFTCEPNTTYNVSDIIDYFNNK